MKLSELSWIGSILRGQAKSSGSTTPIGEAHTESVIYATDWASSILRTSLDANAAEESARSHWVERSSAMAVGDVTSTKRGSGARFNDNKVPLELIPARLLVVWMQELLGPDAERARELMLYVGMFEEGTLSAEGLLRSVRLSELFDAAFVFQYGTKKYAAWNWAKGMAWSVPLGCVKRHLMQHATEGQLDHESGLSHLGHAVCNIIMLAHYERYFTEGDDRPPAEVFNDAVAS